MIHIHCRKFGYQGEQQHGHNFCEALSQHYQIALHSWDKIPDPGSLSDSTRTMLNNANCKHNPSCAIGVGPIGGMADLRGDYKIAFIAWETSRIPPEKLRFLKNVDEIWSPSAWGQTLFVNNGIDRSRISVIPEGVDTELFRPLKQIPETRSDRPFTDRPFRFLCVGKWEVRKGMDRLLQAWSKAFSKTDNVELILHCHNPFIPGFDLHSILEQANVQSAPVILSKPMDSTFNMVSLYNRCDAFVLPTRAEGWGLPIIEAMACAKPVIVTDYSAHRTYVTQDNAYLIDVKRMMNVRDPLFFEDDLNFGQWADPDVDHLIQLLRHVVRHPEEARNKGQQARKDITAQWTWNHAAEKATRRLKTLEMGL